MPKNICVDLNVIVDVFLKRKGFEASRDIIRLGEQSAARLFISAHSVTTLDYLLKNAKVPRSERLKHLKWVMDTFSVVPTDEQVLRAAAESRLADYEDAVVEQAALRAGTEAIVTRNLRDFRESAVTAFTPEQYTSR